MFRILIMFKIIFFVVVLDFHQHCYGNLTQYDRSNCRLTQNVSSNHISSQNSQSEITFETKLEPKIEKNLEQSIETNESQKGSQKVWTKDSQHFLKQALVGSQINNLQVSDTQSSKMSLQDSVEARNQNANENTIGLKDNVRFFRRNKYWKPKRIHFNSRSYPNEQDIKSFKIGYDQPLKSHKNAQNKVQFFSGCCTVMSNTILIRNSGSKPVHNFNAPDYLPPIDTTTTKAPEYLPPNTEIKFPNMHTTTVSYPKERGDIPDDDFTTISPVIAMLLPPKYDEIAGEPPGAPVPRTSSSKVNIPTKHAFESKNILMEEKSLSTTPSFKGIEYLPSENPKMIVSVRPTPQPPGPEPAMAMPVPPEPDDNDTLAMTTSTTTTTKIQDHHQTKESLPKSTTKPTVSTATTFSGASSVMAIPVPAEPEDRPSTSLPSFTDVGRSPEASNTAFSTTTSTSCTNISTPIVPYLDRNPFKALEYLPPKEMVPVLSPASMPVPEPDCCCTCDPNETKIDFRSSAAANPCQSTEKQNRSASTDNPNLRLDPRSTDDADPYQSTDKPNKPASNENPNIDLTSTDAADPCRSTDNPKIDPRIPATIDPRRSKEMSNKPALDENPNIDLTSTGAADPCLSTDKPNKPASNENLNIDLTSTDDADTCRSIENSKIDPRSPATIYPRQSTDKPNKPASNENPKLDLTSTDDADPCRNTENPKIDPRSPTNIDPCQSTDKPYKPATNIDPTTSDAADPYQSTEKPSKPLLSYLPPRKGINGIRAV